MKRMPISPSSRSMARNVTMFAIVAATVLSASARFASADFVFLPLNTSQVESGVAGDVWSYGRSMHSNGTTTELSRTVYFNPHINGRNTLSIRDFDGFGFSVESAVDAAWVADYSFGFTDLQGAVHMFTGSVTSDDGDFAGDFDIDPVALQFVNRVDLSLALTAGVFQPKYVETRLLGGTVTLVPEPAVLGLFALASVFMLTRRRR